MAETGDWSRCIIPFDEARARVHERGLSHPFVGAAIGAGQLQMHLSEIRPGEAAHPPHSHAGEEIMFLLEGRADAVSGDPDGLNAGRMPRHRPNATPPARNATAITASAKE